jgi:nitrogenase molybdenum-iron protein NifN
LPVVHASTPSYKDGHVEGFHSMVHAIVRDVADDPGPREEAVNVLPPLVSPADLRHLREVTESFGLRATLLPDYSDTLDGVILDRYRALPSGGTPLNEIKSMTRASRTVDFTLTGKAPRASKVLEDRGVRASLLPLPIGVVATDAFVDVLREVSGRPPAPWLEAERGRLLDAYADGHKYVFGKPIAVYGDPEFVVGMARFLLEIGARPVVCATGARNRALTKGLAELPGFAGEILDDTDFSAIEAACRRTRPELMIGSSKGYRVARELGVPLIRIGFPIHDRIGASRVLHLGYRGTTQLFDMLVNALLERKQDSSPIGFSYL